MRREISTACRGVERVVAWSLCFPSLPQLPGGHWRHSRGAGCSQGLAVGTSSLSPATTAATGPAGWDWWHGLPVALAVLLLLLCDPEKDHND